MYGVIDFAHIDTTPGAGGAFAPPLGFAGDYRAYKALLRERYERDVGAAQHIACVARQLRRPIGTAVIPEFSGPYAQHARWIARQL